MDASDTSQADGSALRGVATGCVLTLAILLLAMIGVGWAQSYRAQHLISAWFDNDSVYSLRSAEGVLVVIVSRDWSAPYGTRPDPRLWASTHGRGQAIPDTTFWNRRGFFFSNTANGFSIAFPYWLAAAVASVAPVSILWRAARRRYLPRRGLCPHCGYDLRATPGRCPECGTASTN